MILLNTGTNLITVTTNENVTIVNPQYIFIFVNDNTNRKVACTQVEYDVVDFKSRFSIEVGVNSPLLGKVLLDDYGFYKYYIYETITASSFDYANVDSLDLRTMTGLLEEGKMYWQEPTVTNNYYKDLKGSSVSYGQ
jgi:hypothetical protein